MYDLFKDSNYYKLLLASKGMQYLGLDKNEALHKSQDVAVVLSKLLENVALELYSNGEWVNTFYPFIKLNIQQEAKREAEMFWAGVTDKAEAMKKLIGKQIAMPL